MPVIKSAIKRVRQIKKRTARNKAIKKRLKSLIKTTLAEPSKDNIKKAVSVIDKAAKRHVIHKNKAARLKSRIMRKAVVEKKAAKEKKAKPKKAVAKKRKVVKAAGRKKT